MLKAKYQPFAVSSFTMELWGKVFLDQCAQCSCNYMVSPLCQIDFKARLTSWGLYQITNWGKQLVACAKLSKLAADRTILLVQYYYMFNSSLINLIRGTES